MQSKVRKQLEERRARHNEYRKRLSELQREQQEVTGLLVTNSGAIEALEALLAESVPEEKSAEAPTNAQEGQDGAFAGE